MGSKTIGDISITINTLSGFGLFFCFFSFVTLSNLRLPGSYSVKLLLLADGLICISHILNTAKPITISGVDFTRLFAGASMGLSNWWVVCMTFNRCIFLVKNHYWPNTTGTFDQISRRLQNCLVQTMQFLVLLVACVTLAAFASIHQTALQRTVQDPIFCIIPIVLVIIICALSIHCLTRLLEQERRVVLLKQAKTCSEVNSCVTEMSSNLQQRRKILHQVAPIIIGLSATFVICEMIQVVNNYYLSMYTIYMKVITILIKTMINAGILCSKWLKIGLSKLLKCLLQKINFRRRCGYVDPHSGRIVTRRRRRRTARGRRRPTNLRSNQHSSHQQLAMESSPSTSEPLSRPIHIKLPRPMSNKTSTGSSSASANISVAWDPVAERILVYRLPPTPT